MDDWIRGTRAAAGAAPAGRQRAAGRILAVLGAALLVVLLGLSWHWSRVPRLAPLIAGADAAQVPGARTTATLIALVDTLLEKPGGYLSNDVLPPGVWLDNIPNWEYGVVVQARDAAKAFREAFSRSQSQSTEDRDLALAEPLLNFDNESWIFPATEDQYRKGRDHLTRYYQRLVDGERRGARFYARADNLRYWLGTVQNRLGSLSQRLSASVGQRHFDGTAPGAGAAPAPQPAEEAVVRTSWWEIDDVFFEARGATWALLQLLRAVEQDFAEVLRNKNAQVSVRQIIRELEAAQRPLAAPLILNGGGFGLLANHSITMASYIGRANAALIDLRDLLAEG
ncbi:MAG: DUF2333 family protein [Pseudomonadota bacterium]